MKRRTNREVANTGTFGITVIKHSPGKKEGEGRREKEDEKERRGRALSGAKRPFKGSRLGQRAFLRGAQPTSLSSSTRRERPISLSETVPTSTKRRFKNTRDHVQHFVGGIWGRADEKILRQGSNSFGTERLFFCFPSPLLLFLSCSLA